LGQNKKTFAQKRCAVFRA